MDDRTAFFVMYWVIGFAVIYPLVSFANRCCNLNRFLAIVIEKESR